MTKPMRFGKIVCMIVISFSIIQTPGFGYEMTDDEAEISFFELESLLNMKVTTAGLKAEKVAEIPASVVIITREEIERFGYTTLDEILENVPGVYSIDQRDMAGVTLGVRGFWTQFANSIIYLINGVRQERIGTDASVYSSLYVPVETIDRIEVIRGPMGVIYGSGAFFGAINIITNDIEETNFDLVSIGAGSMNTVKASVRVAHRAEDANVAVNAGYYHTDGPDIPYRDMSTLALSDYTSRTSSGGSWGDNNKAINISTSYKGFSANIGFNHNNKGFHYFFPPAKDGGLFHRRYASLMLGYQSDVGDQLAVEGKLSYHSGSVRSNFDWFTPDDHENSSTDFNYREDFELEANVYLNPRPDLSIIGGIYYRRVIKEELLTYFPLAGLDYRLGLFDPIEDWAIFAQADYFLSDRLKFIAGIRLVQALEYSVFTEDNSALQFGGKPLVRNVGSFENNDLETVPRFATILTVNKQNIIKLMYGKAINVPSFYHTVGQVHGGLEPLNSEFIETFEVNYLATMPGFATINTSVFHNSFDNLIVHEPFIDPVTGAWIGASTNAGEITNLGLEVTVQTKPLPNLLLEISGTWQETKDRRDGFDNIDVGYSPPALGYLKAAYAFEKGISLSLTGRYVGEMETHWDISLPNSDGTFGGRIANQVDSYVLFGANARFKNLFAMGFYLNIRGVNILDKQYLNPSFTGNANWADKGIAGNGRRIIVSVGKQF